MAEQQAPSTEYVVLTVNGAEVRQLQLNNHLDYAEQILLAQSALRDLHWALARKDYSAAQLLLGEAGMLLTQVGVAVGIRQMKEPK